MAQAEQVACADITANPRNQSQASFRIRKVAEIMNLATCVVSVVLSLAGGTLAQATKPPAKAKTATEAQIFDQLVVQFERATAGHHLKTAAEILFVCKQVARRLSDTKRIERCARLDKSLTALESAPSAKRPDATSPRGQANPVSGPRPEAGDSTKDRSALDELLDSKDPALVALARRDLAAPKTGPARAAIADEWWAWAHEKRFSELDAVLRRVLARAQSCYQAAGVLNNDPGKLFLGIVAATTHLPAVTPHEGRTVGGVIDTHVRLKRGTYILSESLVVRENGHLYVERGTRILAREDKTIEIRGGMSLFGNRNERCMFAAKDKAWPGLRFGDRARRQVRGLAVRDAEIGIVLLSTKVGRNGHRHEISGCDFQDCGIGLDIRANHLAQPLIKDCVFESNDRAGLQLRGSFATGADVVRCTFIGNKQAGILERTDAEEVRIRDCLITNNKVGIESLTCRVLALRGNQLQNKTWNLVNKREGPTNCADNWWGTTKASRIRGTIQGTGSEIIEPFAKKRPAATSIGARR